MNDEAREAFEYIEKISDYLADHKDDSWPDFLKIAIEEINVLARDKGTRGNPIPTERRQMFNLPEI